MRRFILLTLVLAVIFCGTTAFAEKYDLSQFSNQQLLDLYECVREEMSDRGISATRSLYSGKYIVGEDILPGTYKITCTGTEAEDLGNAYSSLGDAYGALLGDGWGNLLGSLGGAMESLVGTGIKVIGDYGAVIKSIEMKTGDVTTLTLSSGTALEISGGSVTIEAE